MDDRMKPLLIRRAGELLVADEIVKWLLFLNTLNDSGLIVRKGTS